MRRPCPLKYLPVCAGQTDQTLCDPVNARELARQTLYLSSLAGWPASGYRPDPGNPRICPLVFPDPPPPEPEPAPAADAPPVVVAARPRTAKPRGSLEDAIRRKRGRIPRE